MKGTHTRNAKRETINNVCATNIMNASFNIVETIANVDARIDALTIDRDALTSQIDALIAMRATFADVDVDAIANAFATIATLTSNDNDNDVDAIVNDTSITKRERATKLLALNMRVADVARALSTHVSYVHTIKRNAIANNELTA